MAAMIANEKYGFMPFVSVNSAATESRFPARAP